ncbi:MAG: bifunctional pyr operon transcriptional regulator/uracil phosphoribosyltransferase PyrR [Ectothiorhodospiraceae bacterium]|nr:bifunctional pyr operon transcriptional regulator/uracil phosphoribosyltransferase PyrR [Ectothiorhodospiraceae bacterium]MCH8502750.1 bifunctional pyr operon transcriptional regulator/uracil phosphoribosyltransferase PyrR [Ectothiorhodospiraceae bacterium]
MTELPSVPELLDTLERDLRTLLHERGLDDPAMIGIHTGGAWVAADLHRRLALREPLGTLDIAFYRDDFSTRSLHPQVRPSSLPFPVEDRNIILIDDVIFSGRTIRAAMNEIFDYGRPRTIVLAALVDRGQRELPIAADITGYRVSLQPGEQIKLQGPDPLLLTLREST